VSGGTTVEDGEQAGKADRAGLHSQLLNLAMAGSLAKPRLHKPLLVAVLLQRFIQQGSTSSSFAEIEGQLNDLIRRFANSSSPPKAQYPFWRLTQDGFWEIDNSDRLVLNSSGDPKVTDLRDPEFRGRWTKAAVEELRSSGGEVFLESVLNQYFPREKRDVIAALGLPDEAAESAALADAIPDGTSRRQFGRGLSDAENKAIEERTAQVAGAAAGAKVEEVSVEAVPEAVVTSERAEFERTGSVAAVQKEAAMTARFGAYLESFGREVKRYKIKTPTGTFFTDTADVTTEVLYEAKGTAERMSVRLALGQVLDYGRYVKDSALAVLLPEPPAADLVELLENHNVGCVVEGDPGEFTDMTGLGRCP
jgi:hypothetical protein